MHASSFSKYSQVFESCTDFNYLIFHGLIPGRTSFLGKRDIILPLESQTFLVIVVCLVFRLLIKLALD